jgi:hypothetical protein
MQTLKLISCLSFVFTFLFSNSQVIEKGDFIFDPYVGYPNWGNENSYQNSGLTSYSVKSNGPMGVRAEILISDQIGIGVDFIYNSRFIKGTREDIEYVFDESSNQYVELVNVYDYQSLSQRFRLQLRVNYHFDLYNPNLDLYVGYGVGSNVSKYTTLINGTASYPTYEQSIFTFFPFSMRVCTGLRYYFTNKIGINSELGLGGPLLSAGISLKI